MKILNDPDKPTAEELAHYGIRGMKWGVRKGGLGSRVRGALADHDQQNIARLTRMKEGRSIGPGEKLGRAATVVGNFGTKRANKDLSKQITKLEAQKKRAETGKLKARDILTFVGKVNLGDLIVSRQDNKG
jgi:hypothetical protein